MHPPTPHLLLLLLALASLASAASHDILVGSSGLAFTPNSTTAAAGDTLVFHFYPGHHSVVQGQFSTPCSTAGGFFSGYIDSSSGAASEVFTVTVNDTNPIWVYCSSLGHCQNGMAMVVNPPSSGDTLAAYIAAAEKTGSSITPANVGGGVISSDSSSSGSSSSSSSVASSSSSAVSVSSSASSSAGSTSGSSSATTTSASSTTSASASSTANAGSVVGRGEVLSGVSVMLAAVSFWFGLL